MAEAVMSRLHKCTPYPPDPQLAGSFGPLDGGWRLDIGHDGKPVRLVVDGVEVWAPKPIDNTGQDGRG
jgi:hypothetical protein